MFKMTKHLVIVESPSKAKTIKKYLGADFDVTASVGHIKDLPKNAMGVDVEKSFKPQYVTVRGKNNVLKAIREKAKKAEIVYLGPDPDREGEAIAWHLANEVKKANKGSKVYRILINEITKKGVNDALQKPKTVNESRFYSQQTRRILDRLVGYHISPLLWNKVRRGLSAGRVQSVAVRLIVDREAEINRFDPEEYWTIEAHLNGPEPPPVLSKLVKVGGKKAKLSNGEQAHAIVKACQDGSFVVSKITRKERKRNPQPPFTTSTLQQAGAQRLRYTAKRTMRVAQQLYEGIDLGDEGAVGLITYMRTDSTRLSKDFVDGCRAYIKETFGADHHPEKPRVFKTKKGAQDAHEAIRPTSMAYPPDRVKSYLSGEQFKLYQLIWNRFVACQMEAARYDQTRIDIANGENLFRTTGSVMTFAGYLKVYGETAGEDEGKMLPKLDEGQTLELVDLQANQHFTQPPPRFNEATLVKELEEKGIGRPSTYATIISTIQDKGYVEKEKARFSPTELGTVVTQLLVECFPDILSADFTARMESELDMIEEGEMVWTDVLERFYSPFSTTLDKAKEEMRNLKKESTPTELSCPTCKKTLVIKWGKNGYFLGCETYPDCRFTSEFAKEEDGTIVLVEEEVEVMGECEKCGSDMIVKSGRYGRFLACSNYPECKNTKGFAIGVACPKCSSDIIEKRSRRGKTFYGCETYPKCDFAAWQRPVLMDCPSCGSNYLTEKETGEGINCPVCKASYSSLEEVKEFASSENDSESPS
jgi:DNA topoisomerase-1